MSEKKKKTSNHLNRWLFLALWTFSHTFAWFGTFGLAQVVNPRSDIELLLAFIFILGIAPGVLLSFPQKWLMKRGLDLNINGWRRGSLMGWALGGLLLWLLVSPIASEPPLPIVIGTWFGAFILAQYALMRTHIQRASLYALANLSSVIVFGQFAGLYGDVNLGRFAIAGGLQGAVTGLTLLWLYGMVQQDKKKLTQAQDDAAINRLSDTGDEDSYSSEAERISVSKQSLEA